MSDLLSLALSLASSHVGVYALVLARVLGMAATAPGWGTPGLGWRIRLGLAAMVTLAVAPAVNLGLTRPLNGWHVAQLVPIELAVGAMLGQAMSLLLAGARQAGELVGMQSGLSAASLFDPEAGDDLNPIGHVYGLVAMGAFLAMDGPLALVGSLVESYRAIPVDGLGLSPETVDLMFARVGWALSLAVRAAAPAALALVLAGVALGLLGRAAPSLQLMSLALPIRVAVGLVLVLLGLASLAGVFASAWGEIFL
ncbi:MAG: flagellar biosynthesis pathway, component FliR [Planctomycetota bacterium]|nr:flagellar biosynthesis pathway, component FliR [Planctomycetota bacterium]